MQRALEAVAAAAGDLDRRRRVPGRAPAGSHRDAPEGSRRGHRRAGGGGPAKPARPRRGRAPCPSWRARRSSTRCWAGRARASRRRCRSCRRSRRPRCCGEGGAGPMAPVVVRSRRRGARRGGPLPTRMREGPLRPAHYAMMIVGARGADRRVGAGGVGRDPRAHRAQDAGAEGGRRAAFALTRAPSPPGPMGVTDPWTIRKPIAASVSRRPHPPAPLSLVRPVHSLIVVPRVPDQGEGDRIRSPLSLVRHPQPCVLEKDSRPGRGGPW